MILNLKVLREKQQINMREAAKKLGIPYTTYVSYEKGEQNPSIKMLLILADYFGCTVDYLLGRNEEESA